MVSESTQCKLLKGELAILHTSSTVKEVHVHSGQLKMKLVHILLTQSSSSIAST